MTFYRPDEEEDADGIFGKGIETVDDSHVEDNYTGNYDEEYVEDPEDNYVDGYDEEYAKDTKEDYIDESYSEENRAEQHTNGRVEYEDMNAGGITEADVVYAPLIVSTGRTGKKYKLPSQISQMSSVYAVQMKQYAKSLKPFLFIMLAALIFLVPFAVESVYPDTFADSEISLLLTMLPYMIAFIPAMFAGKILSSEFKNRTAYMVFPLPISRTAFYMGKFLAALTLCYGAVLLGFGIALVTSDMYGLYVPETVSTAIILALCAVFAIAAMAYMLSTFLKKGSLGVMMVIMFVIPVILAGGWAFFLEYMIGEGYIDTQMADATVKVLIFLPIYAYAPVMLRLGIGMEGLPSLPFYTMGFDPGFANVLLFEPCDFALAFLVTGIIFLIIGLIKINRKEL